MKGLYQIGIFLSAFLWLCSSSTMAAQSKKELFNPSGLEIPRYVTLKSDKVFARKGPGTRFPIRWIYQRKGMPVEVVQEFDTWRKIKDFDGEESWVHQSLISGKRKAITINEPYTQLFTKNEKDSDVMALAEKGVVLEVFACFEGRCRVKSGIYRGWISKKDIWGIYESEQFQ